ncbi:terminase [Klebsiella phage KPP2020]|uniref:Terminase n=1 Tax=Klebsiella phage KPP2020 TaxID=3017288 RepID=A0AAF0BYB6_9CAUD|nr:terminase [Klebsiella phage KPP2020]
MTVKRHLPNQWKYTPCSLPWTALVDEYGIGIPAKVRSLVVAENRGMAIPPGLSRAGGWGIAPPKRRYCDYLPWRAR